MRDPAARSISGASPLDRRRARSWALQIHYRWESEGRSRPMGEVLDETLVRRTVGPARIPYLRRLIAALEAHPDEVDAALDAALDNWRLPRLSTIDRGILRLAATELLFLPDIPPRVSIHEAIRMAEGYGGPRSPAFVNGVLDALARAASSAE